MSEDLSKTSQRPVPHLEALRKAYDCLKAGELAQAIEIGRAVSEQDPGCAAAWHVWGLAEHQAGAHARAAELLATAARLEPQRAIYHNHWGAALEAQGLSAESLERFATAERLDPRFFEAAANASAVFERLGQLEAALAALRRARAIVPEREDLLRRESRLLAAQGDVTRALQLYRRGIVATPNNAKLHRDLGNLMLATDAAEASQALRRSVELDPKLAEAWFNLGQAYAAQDRFDEAQVAFAQANELRPNFRAWQLRSRLQCPPVFETAAAIQAFHAGFERRIDAGELELTGVSLGELPGSGFHPPYTMNFHGLETRRYKEKLAALVRPLVSAHEAHPIKRSGRVRVGFAITQGHERLFLRCTGGIVERLDPREFEVQVLASRGCLPALRAGLAAPHVQFIALPPTITAAMQALADARCDVLYHWEASSDDTNYLLPFAKAAPVQCTSWGTQVTSGIAEVDYYLSSRWIETDDADRHYTETLWRLESLPTWQRRIAQPPPTDKAHFGFSDEQHVYLCPQNLLKIHPDQDELFRQILESDAQAIIALKQNRYPTAARLLMQRLQRHLGALAERIVMLPWLSQTDYFRLVSVADAVLAPVHYSAGSSSYDMFSFDQPIVTWPSQLNVGRYTMACYRRMDFTDLVAQDANDYVRLAVHVASDPDYRQTMRENLRERSEVLFEDAAAVTAHADFFRRAAAEVRGKPT